MTGSALVPPALAIGAITGAAIGVISIVSDALVYSRYFRANPMARQYRNPLLQLGLFLAIAIAYGAIQGALFILVRPVLPTGLLAQGAAFGLASYVVLSRHFVEGVVAISPEFVPLRLSAYLATEFFCVYVVQGVLLATLL